MTSADDVTAGSGRGGRMLLATGVAAGAAVGLAAYLRGRRERTEAHVDLRSTPAPGADRSGASDDPAHAPGHQHLAPPPETTAPAAASHADHEYSSGHRDRGGRSAAFRTERGD